MTKKEMIAEMLEDVRWTEKTKEDYINNCKATKKRVEEVYKFWLANPGHSYFCIGIL